MKREWVLGFILAGFVAVGYAEAVDLESPGGSVVIGFELNAGRPQWEVAFNGREIIKESPLGLELEQPYGAFEITGLKTATTDETWKPAWGKFSEIRNCCSELTVSLRETTAPNRRLDIVFRAFDDAAAVRYHFPESGKISIKEDNTHFMFAGDFT
ncbi:MAG: glycoside hydrolase family 97 N-terminal domain-containing protein, partial [Kiritimatiellales bacterium]|nr:glycoside hydrolase family 97 N-terminal domain-containing protein [Kiritimatiellales bacterium]